MSGFARSTFALSVLAAAVACTGGAAEVPAAAPAASPTATAPVAAPTDDDALAFFRAQIDACNAWNAKVGNTAPGAKAFDGSPSDPTRSLKVVERPSAGRYVIEDADGSRVLVDLNTHLVQSPDGAGVPLPIRYTFCPPEVFVGPSGD